MDATFENNTTCPWCLSEHELASNLTDDNAPEDGDVSICIRCLEPSIFSASGTCSGAQASTELKLVKPSSDFRAQLKRSTAYKTLVQIVNKSKQDAPPKEEKQ